MGAVVRGVILAAGASTRMGRAKAGLTLDSTGQTFLAQLVRQFTAARLPDIVIVTGAEPETVRKAAGPLRPPVRFEHNEQWASGQLTSLLAGLRPRFGDALEAIMVTLVDAPLVTDATVRRLLQVWRAQRAPIVRPARGETHGHPVIFDRVVFDDLRGADPRVGAKAVVRSHRECILNVPVDDPGAFVDIDTPDDYERLLRELRH